LGTPDLPLVDIDGSPFLTQVAARSIGPCTWRLIRWAVRTDQTLTVAQVDLVLSDVTTDDWFDTMNVSHAEGTARIDYNVPRGPGRRSADLRRGRPGGNRPPRRHCSAVTCLLASPAGPD
jgi:hypothetical protein